MASPHREAPGEETVSELARLEQARLRAQLGRILIRTADAEAAGGYRPPSVDPDHGARQTRGHRSAEEIAAIDEQRSLTDNVQRHSTNARPWQRCGLGTERRPTGHDVTPDTPHYYTSRRDNVEPFGAHNEEYRQWKRSMDERQEFLQWRRPVDERNDEWLRGDHGFSATMAAGGAMNMPRRTDGGERSRAYQPSFGVTWLSQSQLSARQSASRELPTFSGDVRHWPIFYASYTNSTAICGYSDEENLLRLQRALRGPALDAVEHLLLLPSGLREAVETLRARCGRPDLIVDALVEKVRGLPAPRMERLDTLVDYGTAVKNLCATIRISGMKEYECNVTLLKELTTRLPPVLRLEWAREKQKTLTGRPTLIDFGKWIGDLADAVSGETSPLPRSQQVSGAGPQRQPARTSWLNTYATSEAVVRRCVVCDGDCMTVADCAKFSELSVTARDCIVKASGLCRKCLGRHRGPCRVRGCGKYGCAGAHHRLLHKEREPNERVTSRALHHDAHYYTAPHEDITHNEATSDGRGNSEVRHCFSHSSDGTEDGVLLRYVPVIIYGKGTSVHTFALFDDGSASTFIDHGLIEELGITGKARPLCLSWTGNMMREEADSLEVCLQISGAYDAATVYKLPGVHTVRSLSLPTQSVSVNELARRYDHLGKIPASSYSNASPRILIGLDYCHLFKTLRYREGRWGEPVAAKTRLGWAVFGPVPGSAAMQVESHVCYTTSPTMGDHNLDSVLREHCSLESLGIVRPSQPLCSKEEERALNVLTTRTRLLKQRYETGLIWKYDNVRLPASREMALKRHACLKRKMNKNLELAEAVTKKINEYEAKGYIRRLTHQEHQIKTARDWYLPIFPVSNPNKPGKIRIVFDAAAKSNGFSLNDVLLPGPDQVATLVGVLHKFRENRVAVVGDIREMFFQVQMRQEYQRSQMFFWLGRRDEDEPCTFMVVVMTFGAACSPGSAHYVKNTNADRFAKRFPRAAQAIKYEHYVDDLLASVETEKEAIELAQDVKYIHSQAGFEIRNWLSNSNRVIRELQRGSKGEDTLNLCDESTTEKLVGLWWDTKTDAFVFRLSPHHDDKLLSGAKIPTKHEVLRTLMKVYDPLGLIGHFLMSLKIMLQDAWRSGRQWDEELEDDLAKR